jgi:hypothetical protein
MIFYVGEDAISITTLRVMTVDLSRRYNTHYSDELVVSTVLPLGTYHKLIVPNKDNIKAELIYKQLGKDEEIVFEYRAIPVDITSSPMQQDSEALNTINQGNAGGMDVFYFQLKDEIMEEIELIPIGGIWRTIVPGDLLLGLLDGYSKQIAATREGEPIGVTMQPPDNQEIRDIIPIEHGSPLVDVGDLLQSTHGGIYSSDLGIYFQKGQWYVWSLYDLDYESESPKTLTIIIVPLNKFRKIERTYLETEDQIFIYIVGERKHFDQSDSKIMNEGNAVRYIDSRKQLESWRTMDGEFPMAARGENASEFVGIPKDNKINKVNAVVSTDNPFFLSSKMAGRDGSRLLVNWEDGDPGIIRPDMQVKILFDDDMQVIEYRAKLMELHQFIGSPLQGIANETYTNNVMLHLYLEPKYKIWDDSDELK